MYIAFPGKSILLLERSAMCVYSQAAHAHTEKNESRKNSVAQNHSYSLPRPRPRPRRPWPAEELAAWPGDRETVLRFMYPIYVSAEPKTKKIAVIATHAYVQIHLCMLGCSIHNFGNCYTYTRKWKCHQFYAETRIKEHINSKVCQLFNQRNLLLCWICQNVLHTYIV